MHSSSCDEWAPVRTAFHDAVARFGGFGMASVERFLLAERP
jgi:hypothetical protein